jgi:hypothetical protein
LLLLLLLLMLQLPLNTLQLSQLTVKAPYTLSLHADTAAIAADTSIPPAMQLARRMRSHTPSAQTLTSQ